MLAVAQLKTVVRVREIQRGMETQEVEIVRLADFVKDIAFENNKGVEEK